MQMRSPTNTKTQSSFTPIQTGILQRKCASCGQHTISGEECEECQKKRSLLQRRSTNQSEPSEVPPIVHEVLRSPSQPLDFSTRTFMESKFGQDFSQVRVHTDPKAAESAQAVNALAYSVGKSIVFAAGHYAPGTTLGKRLLAHELTHVVQQRQVSSQVSPLKISTNYGEAEREADKISKQITTDDLGQHIYTQPGLIVQRKIKVERPKDKILRPGGKGLDQTNAVTVQNYLNTLCSGGSVKVAANGEVNINKSFCTPLKLPSLSSFLPFSISPAQISKEPTGCSCICDLDNSKHLWTIKVDDANWPHTLFADYDAARGKKPGGSGGTVTTPSPNSSKLWGAATVSGKALNIDPWLVLGHELCGHAWLGNSGKQPSSPQRGKGGHQETVKRENLLRQEHGIELRGTFKDPHCGESFWRDKKKPAKVNWSSFRSVCEDWRKDYNAKNKTSYKISERIQ